MRAFDLGRAFDFVFITADSLLHLHEAEDLVSCFRSVRRHLAPGARFVLANDTHPAASIGTSTARVLPTNHRSCEIVKLVRYRAVL